MERVANTHENDLTMYELIKILINLNPLCHKYEKNVNKDYSVEACALLDRWGTFHALRERRNFHGGHSMVKVKQ